MSQSLYKISEDYQLLMSELEENEGVMTDEQIEALEITEKQLQAKSIAYLEVIRSNEAFTMLIDNEIKRLQAIKKQKTNLVSILKDRLLNAVKLFGTFQVGTLEFGIRKSKSIVIEDESLIPLDYTTHKVIVTPDKAMIKTAIESGQVVNGAYQIENDNLKIK